MSSNEIEGHGKLINTWNEQWDQICNDIKDYGEMTPKFEDVLVKTESSFSKVIQQTLLDNIQRLEVPLKDIRYGYRVVNEKDEKKVTETRFIPLPEYASLNRMNDKDKIYLYLSISYKDSADKDVKETAIKEIRASSTDAIWGCKFAMQKEFSDCKVIDMSTACKIPREETELIDFLKKKSKKVPFNLYHAIDEAKLTYWLIQTIIDIFECSSMFQLVDKNKSEKEQRKGYKPFHMLCDYLQRKGYIGIIYRSSVCKKGRCLALFDTKYAKCEFDTHIKITDLKQYI